jgi:hypothetical protein
MQQVARPRSQERLVKVERWARSWYLVGNGPAYLLFCSEERRVIHLTSDLELLPRNFREALKGFRAIENGKLTPLVQALCLINTASFYSPLRSNEELNEDFYRCVQASMDILKEIEHLVGQLPDEDSFKVQLARFTSLIKAARRFVLSQIEAYGTSQFEVSWDDERGKSRWLDCHGDEVLISDYWDLPGPKRAFRCVPRSPIARCVLDLWTREQTERGGNQFTSLYYIPTRKELRRAFCTDESAITKMCRAEGFGWLPRAPRRHRAGLPKRLRET